MEGKRRRSAALNVLEELAALPELGAEGLLAATLATRELVPVDGAVIDLRNADADVVGCIVDGQCFTEENGRRFFANYCDTPAEDLLGPNCRALFRERAPFRRAPLAITTAERTRGWQESELYQFFSSFGAGELIRLPLWRGTIPLGMIVLGRGSDARPLTDRDLSTLLQIRSLCEQIVERAVAPVSLKASHLAAEATWVARLTGEIELESPGAEWMAAMAFGFEGMMPGFDRQVSTWLRETFRSLRERLDRGEPALLERTSGYGLFQFRASWLEASGGTVPRARLSVRLTRHVLLKSRLFLSQRFRQLPRREKQAVLALAEGISTQELASRMEVAPSTVLSWIRSLYNRFEVNRRGDLISLLLANAEPAERGRSSPHLPRAL